jgi:hypothetical protein
VVHRTQRQEKIRLFARLFEAANAKAEKISVDESDELLRILDELSVKDFKVLRALEEYETQYYKTVGSQAKADSRASSISSRRTASVYPTTSSPTMRSEGL